MLACDAQKVKIGEIVQSLEPNLHLVECFDRNTNTCKITSNCHLKHYLHEAAAAFIAVLNTYTLADAVNGKGLKLTLS